MVAASRRAAEKDGRRAGPRSGRADLGPGEHQAAASLLFAAAAATATAEMRRDAVVNGRSARGVVEVITGIAGPARHREKSGPVLTNSASQAPGRNAVWRVVEPDELSVADGRGEHPAIPLGAVGRGGAIDRDLPASVEGASGASRRRACRQKSA